MQSVQVAVKMEEAPQSREYEAHELEAMVYMMSVIEAFLQVLVERGVPLDEEEKISVPAE
jgi:hypothetical protein